MILFDTILLEYMLLIFLIGCALAVSLTRKVISAVIIFMSYSIVMSIVWLQLEAPDLALTEAAIGAGITSILFFLAIKRINTMERQKGGRSAWQTEAKTETKAEAKTETKTDKAPSDDS